MAHIEIVTGDIFTASVEAIVNPVNCIGVMGRGLALQFKQAYPANFKAYKAACDAQLVYPGQVFTSDTGGVLPRYVINFPTKRHWKDRSYITDIESGLLGLAGEVQKCGIRSIAIPALGAGLGGLNWSDVLPRIKSALKDIPDLHVLVFAPV